MFPEVDFKVGVPHNLIPTAAEEVDAVILIFPATVIVVLSPTSPNPLVPPVALITRLPPTVN